MTSDSLEKKGVSEENPSEETGFFLIKSIRQYPDPYAFWRHEATSLTLTDDTPDYEKNRPLRFGGEKKPYTLRIDGPQKVKERPLYKKYDENQKKWNYSKHKSLTAVKEGFYPPAFSFNKLNNQADPDSVEVGYMLPAKPEYALERRILQGKGGTIHRNFRYDTEGEAKKAWDQGLNSTIFRTLDRLAEHGDPKQVNEVMAHVKWGPEARIAYFKDNLNSRLRAISLAHDMSIRLREQHIKNKDGEDSKSILPDAKELPHVPIYSYLPKEGNREAVIELYEKQEEDISLGLESKNVKTRAFARFIQLQKNDFLKKEEDDYSPEELEIFIKIAADLTYESSIRFFQNFFLPNQELISQKLEKNPHLLRDIFRCVPLDKRSELIYPLLTTPESRGYYLHSLLKFDCLEHDTEEFFKQLESGEKINFEVVGEYKPTNLQWKIVEVQDRNGNTPLHLAATKNKVKAAERLLLNKASINAMNKEGKTPLDLAIELENTGMIKFLLEEGGKISMGRKPVNLLHLAIKQGDCDLVKYIIEKSPSLVSMRDNAGLSALYHAISSNNSSVLKLLLERVPKFVYTVNPLRYAFSNNRLEMAKLLIEKGVHVNLLDSSLRTALDWAVLENKLVAADLLLSHGGIYSNETSKINSSQYAITQKNWAVIDFIFGREGISFLSLVPDFSKKTFAMLLTLGIVLGAGYAAYKSIDPSLSEEFAKVTDMGGILLILIPIGLSLVFIPDFINSFTFAKKNYEELQKHTEKKETVFAQKKSLRALGVKEPSVAGVLKHFDSLSSLNQQAEKLMKIAEIDNKLSLYVIIRLFNSDVERASNILWEVSRLAENTRKKFCDLFEHPTSDELEVIVGCVTQKIKEEKLDQAFDILNMFSAPTKKEILERLDPVYRKPIKEHLITISDQKIRINVVAQVITTTTQSAQIDYTGTRDLKQHSTSSTTIGRDTFFYHNPPLDVKNLKKSPDFFWQLKEVTPHFLAEKIKVDGAKEVLTYLQGSIEQGGLGLDEESARAHLAWVFAKYENEIPDNRQVEILGKTLA